MAVKLRLKRMGAKKRPFYRVVAVDARSQRDGRYIDAVGTYNPITEPAEVVLNEPKVFTWLDRGAVPTDTVKALLRSQGVLRRWREAKAAEAQKVEAAETPAQVEPAQTEPETAEEDGSEEG